MSRSKRNCVILAVVLLALGGLFLFRGGSPFCGFGKSEAVVDLSLVPPVPVQPFFDDKSPLAWEPPPFSMPPGADAPGSLIRLGQPRTPRHVWGFSPDGKFIATSPASMHVYGQRCPIELWDATTGTHRHTLPGHVSAVMSVAFSADGSLLASGGMDNMLRLWDTASGTQRWHDIPHQGHVYSVNFARDGFLLATGSNDLGVIARPLLANHKT